MMKTQNDFMQNNKSKGFGKTPVGSPMAVTGLGTTHHTTFNQGFLPTITDNAPTPMYTDNFQTIQ